MSEVAREIDVDALYDRAMGHSPEPEVKQESSESSKQDMVSESDSKSEETTKWGPSEDGSWRIKWNGEEKVLDSSKARQLVQMGFDYNTKMHDLNVQRKEFERLKHESEKMWGQDKERYEHALKLDQWARENPDLYAKVQNAYDQQQQYGTYDPQMQSSDPVISQLMQKVESLQVRLEEQDRFKEQQAEIESEARTDTTISEYKHRYSELDWDTEDDDGMRLESKIMQFGLEKGLADFEDAANLYLMPDLLKREKLKAREEATRNMQNRTRLGQGPITKEPSLTTKNISKAKKGSGYEDVHNILSELGRS